MNVLRYVKDRPDAVEPSYGSNGANAFDLASVEDLMLMPGERALVGTGIKVELEYPQALFILPRSGLAWKYGITVLNAPGLVDSDYRGEVKVILVNMGLETMKIPKGTRIAQGLVLSAPRYVLSETVEVSETERGDRGFGSTGD